MKRLEVRVGDTPGGCIGRNWLCTVCGKWFEADHVGAVVYVDGEKWGDACPECVHGGPEHIREMLLKHAEDLRKRAATYLEDADKLERLAPTAEIVLPQCGEFEEAYQVVAKGWGWDHEEALKAGDYSYLRAGSP